MGRPYTILKHDFSSALTSYFRHNNILCYNDQELYKSFSSLEKKERKYVWAYIAESLGRSSVQAKNYFFNSWVNTVKNSSASSLTVDSELIQQVPDLGFSIFDV
ncbi:Hypothetical_protein [Hexamita inflata]|uniref:Hypothetical_protein n=1 Tax=Hexamita inflata TaxID=28002 RepID=A0AA86QMD9_9EUKA|nr:Hypothetical protein HINF_LOCUS37379 [Hexamita inflata]CAI9954365.1 Hypothetical protein HINF_LOCUS42010 [Hexamita inflata]CAI9954828.1 Hypothetical protein HINF_LOCUS42473 [Hexamita inflata]